MYPLGHLGIALVIGTLFYMPIAALVIGVFLPDIVDKGLAWTGFISCSRSLAHNVFFSMGAGAVTLAITKKKSLALAIFLGCILHLAQDSAHFVPYFYPLLNYDFGFCDPHPVFQPGNFEIAMEVVGLGLIVVWWKWRAKLIYLRERILKAKRLKRVFG